MFKWRTDWPIFIVLLLLLWFRVAQSDHRWNNAGCTTPTYYQANIKSVANAAFIQAYTAAANFRLRDDKNLHDFIERHIRNDEENVICPECERGDSIVVIIEEDTSVPGNCILKWVCYACQETQYIFYDY